MRSLILSIAAKVILTGFLCGFALCQLFDWMREVRKPKHAG